MLLLLSILPLLAPTNGFQKPIPRHPLVTLFNPTRHAFLQNTSTPMQVGNGNFAFGADITGLQTLHPFAIMSSWAWKNDTLPPGKTIADLEAYHGVSWLSHGRPVQYDFGGGGGVEQWLISNPNRVNLGRVGLAFWSAEGTLLNVSGSDFTDIRQELDLWTGTMTSRFVFRGTRMTVQIAAADETSSIGVTIRSSLLRSGRLGVFLDFPWNDGKAKFSAPFVGNWDAAANHTTVLETTGTGSASIVHTMDSAVFDTRIVGDRFSISRDAPMAHRYSLRPLDRSSSFSITVDYSPHGTTKKINPAVDIFADSAKAWEEYWTRSGFVDVLTGSTDPRAVELQRRIILSRYLMRVNEAGDSPPQEVMR